MDHLVAGDPSGEPIVLVHGMGTGASAWAPQLADLQDAHSLLAPFLPGYGGTSGPFTLDAARDRVVRLIHEHTQPPVHLCGLSLGALVALDIAHHHPKLVASLVLTAGFVSLPQASVEQNEQVADIVRTYDAATFAQDVLPGLVRDVPEAYREQALKEIGSLTPSDLAELVACDFDANIWISSVHVPALVLCGSQDALNLPLSQELARRLPSATIELIPDAGHVANLDTPKAFSERLRHFVQANTIPTVS